MLKPIFTVCDSKSGVFGAPFVSHNLSTAQRDFARAVNDPSTDIYHYPADYNLICIGEFDDETGDISPYNTPKSLGSGVNFKNKDI